MGATSRPDATGMLGSNSFQLLVMGTFLPALFHPANLPYTILLILVMLYWLTVFIGALDLDFLDFDLDTEVDAEVDVDLEAEVDSEVSAAAGGSALMGVATFFNLGQVPFMIFFSLLILTMWTTAMLAWQAFGEAMPWFPLLWLLPNLLIGLFVTKLLSSPFKRLHRHMNREGVRKRDLVGKTGRVIITVRPGRTGRIELDTEAHHFVLDVITHGTETLEVGSQAIVVEYDAVADRYAVEGFEI